MRETRFEEAVRYFDAALALQPRAANTLAMRGECQDALGRPKTALTDCERALFLGVRDPERRAELSALVSRLYERLYGENPSPPLVEKALAHARQTAARPADLERLVAMAERVGAAVHSPTEHELAAASQRMAEAYWVPTREYGGLLFGGRLRGAPLGLVRLKPSPTEAWVTQDERLMLTVYTEHGLVTSVKTQHSTLLEGREIIGMSRPSLEQLLGKPESTGQAQGDDYLDFPRLGATFFLGGGHVAEGILTAAASAAR